MDDVIREVRRTFGREWERLKVSEGPLLLGCSAGGDSMALLDLVLGIVDSSAVTVLHFDHAQRAESGEEALFVAQRCCELGVSFQTERHSSEHSGASEAELREARWSFFRRSAESLGSRTLILAHQADDRAETFLIRLLAGSGPTGLASIRPREKLKHGLEVFRPLLALRRKTLRDYLSARSLSWRDDPSNEDLVTKRSWVRHALIPFIDARIEHEVTPHLVRAAELIEEESALAGEVYADFYATVIEPGETNVPPRLNLRHPRWKKAPDPIRRRLLRDWLWRMTARDHPPGYEAVQEALNFARRGARGTRLHTVGGWWLEKGEGYLAALPPE